MYRSSIKSPIKAIFAAGRCSISSINRVGMGKDCIGLKPKIPAAASFAAVVRRYNAQSGGIMSRLDRHIAVVQNKIALGRFVQALIWAIMVYLSLIWIAVTIQRVFAVHPPKPMIWIYVL